MCKTRKHWHWCCIITFLLSVVAIIMSGITIALCYPRIESDTLTLDYQGIYVAIFSALVTLLIGWNIYSLVDFNKRAKKVSILEKKYTSLRNTVRAENSFNQNLSKIYSLFTQAGAQTEIRNYALSLKQYVQVLYIYETAGRKLQKEVFQTKENVLCNIENIFKRINTDFKINEKIYLDWDLEYDKEYNKYKSLLFGKGAYLPFLKRIDNFIIEIAESKEFVSGAHFKLFRWDVNLQPRDNAVFLLLNESKKILKLVTTSQKLGEELKKDRYCECKYIGVYNCISTEEQHILIDKIRQTYDLKEDK